MQDIKEIKVSLDPLDVPLLVLREIRGKEDSLELKEIKERMDILDQLDPKDPLVRSVLPVMMDYLVLTEGLVSKVRIFIGLPVKKN